MAWPAPGANATADGDVTAASSPPSGGDSPASSGNAPCCTSASPSTPGPAVTGGSSAAAAAATPDDSTPPGALTSPSVRTTAFATSTSAARPRPGYSALYSRSNALNASDGASGAGVPAGAPPSSVSGLPARASNSIKDTFMHNSPPFGSIHRAATIRGGTTVGISPDTGRVSGIGMSVNVSVQVDGGPQARTFRGRTREEGPACFRSHLVARASCP